MTEWILSSVILILAVILLRTCFRRSISPVLSYALWAVVLLRLLIPVSLFSSPVNVHTATQQLEATPQVQSITIDLHTPAQSFDNALDEVLQEENISREELETLPSAQHDVIYDKAQEKETQSTPLYTLEHILLGVWIGGIAVVGLCLCLINLHFYLQQRRSRTAIHCKGIPCRVYVSSAVDTPCLFGLFRPSIYLPPETAANAQHLDHVLTHELTHFRHGDHIWAVLRCACLVLHWYNPLVWVAAILSRADAELACDYDTVRKLGENNRLEYGKTLIEMTCTKPTAKTLMLTATTMQSGKKTLKERIRFVAKKPKLIIASVISVLVIAALVIGFTFSGTKDVDIPEENVIYRSEDILVAKVDVAEPKVITQAQWTYTQLDEAIINGNTPVLAGTLTNVREATVHYTQTGISKESTITLFDLEVTDIVYKAGMTLAVGDTVTVGLDFSSHNWADGLPLLQVGKQFLLIGEKPETLSPHPLEIKDYTDLWITAPNVCMLEMFDQSCLVSEAFSSYLLDSARVTADSQAPEQIAARQLLSARSDTTPAEQPYPLIGEYEFIRKIVRKLSLETVVSLSYGEGYEYTKNGYYPHIHRGLPTLDLFTVSLDTSMLKTGAFYLLNQKTNEFTLLLDGPIRTYWATQEHIYYVSEAEPATLYRMGYDGTGSTPVFTSDAGSITYLTYSGKNAWGKVGVILENDTIALYDISAKSFQILVEKADINDRGFAFDQNSPSISYNNKQDTRSYTYNYETKQLSFKPDLESINELLPNDWENRIATTLFDRPEDIDLSALFHGGITQEISQEELDYLVNKGFETAMDIQKNSVAEMDRILRGLLGIGLEDTKGIGLEKMVYSPEYDSYYTNNNDTNRIDWKVYDIQRDNDGYLIYYTSDRGTGTAGKYVMKIVPYPPSTSSYYDPDAFYSHVVYNKPVE